MKTLLVALLIIAVVTAKYTQIEALQIFQTWKINHLKIYENEEQEIYRFQIFMQNLDTISQLNAEQPDARFAANKFADLHPAEFKAIYLNLIAQERPDAQLSEDNSENFPDSLDWTTKGAVTGVKDQGQCGSCWAFSTVATIEGQYFLQLNKPLTSFSEQELVDCDTKDDGCNGGLMDNAFQWLSQTNGLMTEANYPYTAVKGTCVKDPTKYLVSVQSYKDITKGDENAMLTSIQNAPLATAMHADSLQFYAGGIFNPLMCSKSLDHGVTTVGYGVDKKNFWKVKNSWGSDWGEQGYFRIIRGKDMCGIADQVSFVYVQ